MLKIVLRTNVLTFMQPFLDEDIIKISGATFKAGSKIFVSRPRNMDLAGHEILVVPVVNTNLFIIVEHLGELNAAEPAK